MKKSMACFLAFLLVSSPIYADWVSEIMTDAMSDEKSLFIFYIDYPNSVSDSVTILCHENVTMVGFRVPDEERINNNSVQYRFDKEPAERMIMDIIPGGEMAMFIHKSKGVIKTDETLNFIKKMLSKNRLLLRVSTENLYTDIEVDLIGLSDHLEPNLELCGVKF